MRFRLNKRAMTGEEKQLLLGVRVKSAVFEQKRLAAKRLKLIMEKLEDVALFVEGKNDKLALEALGFKEIYLVSGTLKQSCENAAKNGVTKAVILTDLDERGDELAFEASEELRRYGITPDTELRKAIGGMLKLRHFEDMKKKLEAFLLEIKD